MSVKTCVKLTVVLIIAANFACNIFEPKELDPDKWYMTGEAWVIEGKKEMWEEDWQGAAGDFARAIDKDSSLSEAWFYLGKCILRLNNVDLSQVWDEIKPEGEGQSKDNVPFLYQPPEGVGIKDLLSTPFSITLYTIIVSGDSITIIDVPFTQVDTLIDSVFLERKRIYDAICQSITYLERIHSHPKMDNAIKREQYESDYLVEISVKSILGIIDINNNEKLDWESDENERNAFRILCQDIPSLDEMEFDSLKTISKDPRDIKKNLDLILHSLTQADTSYGNFTKDLVDGDMDSTMANSLGEMIGNFKKILPYFYYDDFKDNDGDYYNTNGTMDTTDLGIILNRQERMIWIDWDYDEKIDVDAAGTMHIGDSAHIKANPTLYEVVDPTDEDFQRYIYKGPYTYEFLGGDWGVDEEILDGEDNDGDSLVDEDTRISADTLDDEGDWGNHDPTTNPNNAIGDSSYNPMVWDSIIIVNDFNMDISSVPADWDTISIVTSEYYLLHVGDYPVYPNDVSSIPTAIKRYKVTSPYKGEFTDGDYGMDEEWYDGLDNDGDGLVDEDVGEHLPDVLMRDELIIRLRELGLRGNQ